MTDYLPPEVLTLIFTRLPAKTLLRCALACKLWYSFITDPDFVDAHLDSQKPDDLFLVQSYRRQCEVEAYSLHNNDENFSKYTSIYPPFPPANNDYYRIIGSCNGVLCLSDDLFSCMNVIILWNPIIHKWLTLPQRRISLKCSRFEGVIGFGFDANCKDYKVVRIVYYNGSRCPAEVDVYTLSSGTWQNISDLGPKLQYFFFPRLPQAYIRGAVHWIASDISGNRNVIVSFNMSSELFHIMELPIPCHIYSLLVSSPKWSLKVIEGSLSLVECEYRRCCIWLMKEYGVSSSWTKKVDIEIDRVVDRLIGYRKNGELLFKVAGSLHSYNPEAMEVRDRVVQEEMRFGIRSIYGNYQFSLDDCALHIESYTESLVLLNIENFGMQTHVEDIETESEKEESESEEEETDSKKEAENRVIAGGQDQGAEAPKV